MRGGARMYGAAARVAVAQHAQRRTHSTHSPRAGHIKSARRLVGVRRGVEQRADKARRVVAVVGARGVWLDHKKMMAVDGREERAENFARGERRKGSQKTPCDSHHRTLPHHRLPSPRHPEERSASIDDARRGRAALLRSSGVHQSPGRALERPRPSSPSPTSFSSSRVASPNATSHRPAAAATQLLGQTPRRCCDSNVTTTRVAMIVSTKTTHAALRLAAPGFSPSGAERARGESSGGEVAAVDSQDTSQDTSQGGVSGGGRQAG